MTKQEVKEKLHKFMGLVLKEKTLQEKLLNLKLMSNDKEVLKERIREQDRLLDEISNLRKKEILPLIEEVAKFVSIRQKEMFEEREAKGEQFTEEEYYSMIADASMDLALDENVRDLMEEITADTLEE